MALRILCVLKSESLKSSLNVSFRQVLPNAPIVWCKDIQSALLEIDKENPFRFVIVHDDYPQKELIELVNLVKKYDYAQPSRLVLLVSKDRSSEESLSQHLSLGFSGMLVEPFTFSAVTEALKVSDNLTMAGSIARLTVAAGLQVKAHLVGQNKMVPGGDILSSVKAACKIFAHENPGQTIKDLAQNLHEMPPEERVKSNFSTMYKGASERVRKMLLSKKEEEKSSLP